MFLEEDKGYFAKVRFGKSIDSGDRDGNTIDERTPEEIKAFFSENIIRIEEEISKIIDTTSQIPPVISAIVTVASTPAFTEENLYTAPILNAVPEINVAPLNSYFDWATAKD